MRIVFATLALSASMLSLAACSEPAEDTAATTAEADPAAMEPATAEAPADAAVLDASTATAEQPYASVPAFNTVLMQSLSAEQAAQVRERLFVPINLNTASEEDIALIPGMTDRMIHEFEEYRPYADMAEFDREIGKYVDEAEVARLRQYVTL